MAAFDCSLDILARSFIHPDLPNIFWVLNQVPTLNTKSQKHGLPIVVQFAGEAQHSPLTGTERPERLHKANL